MKEHKPVQRKLADLNGYDSNSRTHSKEQIDQVANSIRKFGFTNPILIDENNTIIAGHARAQAAGIVGLTDIPCVLLNGLDQHEKAALVIADNKLALNAGWDFDALKSELEFLQDSGFDLSLTGFSMKEIGELIDISEIDIENESDANPYTDKVEGIQYEPHNKKPDVSEIYNVEKYESLKNEIEESLLPTDIKNFLIMAATRHIQFDYQLIADFYSHSDPEIQSLMERSALVILDYDDAIAMGYIKLSAAIAEQYKNDKNKQS